MEPNASKAELQRAAEHYVQILRNGDFDSAFHGLIDLDPGIIHPLMETYHAEMNSEIRKGLLRIIWEFRSPLALPLLCEALRDHRGTLWRTALDGLVTLASHEAIQALESALHDQASDSDRNSDYLEWLREALEQARVAHTRSTTLLDPP